MSTDGPVSFIYVGYGLKEYFTPDICNKIIDDIQLFLYKKNYDQAIEYVAKYISSSFSKY